MKTKIILITSLFLASISNCLAQSPVSGFMKEKGKGAICVSYSSEKYNEVYFNAELVKGIPVFNEVQTTALNVYANYGVTSKLEAIVSLPYIQSVGKGEESFLAANGFENKRSGLQDVSLFFKYKAYSHRMDEGTFDFLVSLGVQTPVGGYKADEGFQSVIAIGNSGTKGMGLAIAQVKLDNGFFLTGQAGYRISTNKVPSAFVSEVKAGYAASKVYTDCWIAFQKSTTKGTDILQPEFQIFFPATQVNYARIGADLYLPVYKGFGLNFGLNAFVAGRNLGKSAGYSIGLVSNF